jgi:hypothetical protein
MDVFRGSCLCQKVIYEFEGPIIRLNFCHCVMCQKAHGAAFAPYMRVLKDNFRVVAGREFIASFASSEGISRTFCRNCGSNLQWIRESSEAMGIAAVTLDTDVDIDPSAQYWCDEAKTWHQPRRDVPQYGAE